MPYDTLVDKEKLERTFTEIGDAIRLKRDIANPIDVEDMPLQISLIEGGGIVTGSCTMETTQRPTIPLPKIYNHIILLYDDFTQDIISPGGWRVYGISYNRNNISVMYRIYTNGNKNNATFSTDPVLSVDGVTFNVSTNGSMIKGNYTYFAFD